MNMEYFYELFEELPRCGPGDNTSTRKAFGLMKDVPPHPLILDIGCGPGMQTLELARITRGQIIAIDNHQPVLDKLEANAKKAGLADRIEIRNLDMGKMDFPAGHFDIIWSEGALYFLGFENGLRKCRELLKPKGSLAVTEAVWLKADPPDEIRKYFEAEYPDIKDIAGNLELIRRVGLGLAGHFVLPDSAWVDDYYRPMEKRIAVLGRKYAGNEAALEVFAACEREILLFKKYHDYFGYAFFVMERI